MVTSTVQQTLRLFETSAVQEVHEEHCEEHYTTSTLLEETQQLFHTDGSEDELVALIHRAIDAIHELCDQRN